MRKLGLSIGLLAISGFGYSGHSSGSGGDRLEISQSSAWFLSDMRKDRTISYCMDVDENFGLSLHRIRDAVESSILKWTTYLQAKGVNNENYAPLTSQFTLVESCNKDVDLTLYFGTLNERTLPLVDRYYQPVGLAYKERYDYKQLWSKGFIWFAGNKRYPLKQGSEDASAFPDWSIPDALHAVILHELGHVFGVPHVDHTIMRDDIWRFTANSAFLMGDNPKARFWTHIDHESELFRPESQVGMNPPERLRFSNATHELKDVLGRLGVRKMSAIQTAKVEGMYLVLTDNAGAVKLCFTSHTTSKPINVREIFRTSMIEGQYHFHEHASFVGYGELSNCLGDGSSLNIVIDQNIDSSPFSISVIDRGWKQLLLSWESLL